MLLAPDGCYHCAGISVERNSRYCVSPSGLHGRHVESESITALMCTPNVEVRMALQARHTCTIVGLAEFANLVVSQSACANSFDHIEAVGVAEFDLCMPKCAVDMHPVVICGTLKRFARDKWSAFLLLTNAVLFSGVLNKLSLEALLLPVSVTLLLVCDFRLLVEV
jgi:hypothetical protein